MTRWPRRLRMLWLWARHPLQTYRSLVRAEVRAELQRERAQEQLRDARLTIMLDPQAWPGGQRRCEREDGGCGAMVRFPPLSMQRVGDREVFLLRCPNCRKRRRVLVTTPEIRRMQAEARAEVEQGRPGAAFQRLAEACTWGGQAS